MENPCTNPVGVHLQGPLHGACLECAKNLAPVAPKDSRACRTPGCHNTFALKHSRCCRKCVLDPNRKDDLVLDMRDKEAVLAMERSDLYRKRKGGSEGSDSKPSLPQPQTIPVDGDPFYLYLPRKHVDLPSYDSQPHYRAWNHCRLCFETVPMVT